MVVERDRRGRARRRARRCSGRSSPRRRRIRRSRGNKSRPRCEPKVTLDLLPTQASSLHAISDRQPQLPLHAAIIVSKFVWRSTARRHGPRTRRRVRVPDVVAHRAAGRHRIGADARGVVVAGDAGGRHRDRVGAGIVDRLASRKTRPETRHRNTSDQSGRSKESELHVTPCARRRRPCENTPQHSQISNHGASGPKLVRERATSTAPPPRPAAREVWSSVATARTSTDRPGSAT